MSSFCIIYLASPRNFQIRETIGLDSSHPTRIQLLRSSIGIAHRCFPSTPILVFHEDYTPQEFESLPEVTEFIKIDFSGFEEYRNPSLRRPYGYLMMCRFFSGIVQTHPALKEYTHYMRLDDDSYFLEPFPRESDIQSLLTQDYVYRSLFIDSQDQQSLYDFTIAFLRNEGYGHTLPILQQELEKKSFLRNGVYTGLAPYNNFHIASQRFWANPMVQRYIQALETEKGILRHGWMDANIHAMIIYILARYCGMHIHHAGWFGYRHNQHLSIANSTAVKYDESLPFGL